MFENTSRDDLCTILRGSLISYKGGAAAVQEVIDADTLQIYRYADRESQLIALNSEDLSFEPAHLGFINGPTHCLYVSRKPSRQFSQGLTRNNVIYDAVRGFETTDYDFIDKVKSLSCYKEIDNLFKGIYPKIDDALNTLSDGVVKNLAISRSFAIRYTGELAYKKDVVGIVDFDNGNVSFLRNKKHLKWIWERYDESV